MNQLLYPNSPIGNVTALARMLGCNVNKLVYIAENTDRYYVANPPEIKPNGKIRQTYRVREPLKSIQGQILRNLLKSVEIPDYLQGGIEGRDYTGDASLHAGRKIEIKEDIVDFFPSVSADKIVIKMWKGLFHFPQPVADMLTRLTTYKGSIPQGASTSTYIGNMVFWDLEPKLESALRERGFLYTRFVDDITVSADRPLTRQEVRTITSSIYSMFKSVRLRPNREKRAVQTGKGAMQVHGLNINSGRATLPKAERARIRAAVKELEELGQCASSWEEIKDQYAVVQGRLGVMAKLHPAEARKYQDKLRLVRNRMNTSK